MKAHGKQPPVLMSGTRPYGRGGAAFHAVREFNALLGNVSCCGQAGLMDLVVATTVSVKARCRTKACQAAFRKAEVLRGF